MNRSTLALVLVGLVASLALAGCLGSTGSGSAADTQSRDQPQDPPDPDRTLPADVSALASVATAKTDGPGEGVWIDEKRDLLFSTNGGGGFQIYNVSDPENVTKLGAIGDVSPRDADILRQDGTTYAVLADGGQGIRVVDTSDPRNPKLVSTADKYASHNLASIPGTPYVYDSTAQGVVEKAQGPVVPVLDLSDPTDPSWKTFPIPETVNGRPVQSDGCHDIYVQEDLGRAYCAGGGGFYTAGGGETFVWNIAEDPLDPKWVGVVDNPSIMYHHQALPGPNGDLLFINDEFIAPNCNGAKEGPVDARQSTANMWVYDISDPSNPEKLSRVQVTDQAVHSNCGSHFGDLAGPDHLVWSWYQAGTLLIDVSDPENPKIEDVKPPGSGQTWDAKYHEGYVFSSSGDLQVFKPVAGGS